MQNSSNNQKLWFNIILGYELKYLYAGLRIFTGERYRIISFDTFLTLEGVKFPTRQNVFEFWFDRPTHQPKYVRMYLQFFLFENISYLLGFLIGGSVAFLFSYVIVFTFLILPYVDRSGPFIGESVSFSYVIPMLLASWFVNQFLDFVFILRGY